MAPAAGLDERSGTIRTFGWADSPVGGFSDLDPGHPLGGRDGGKDAIALKIGHRWLMAVYFPRGKKAFTEVRQKFVTDVAAVSKNSADAFVFVTNQELTLSQRRDLLATTGSVPTELHHLERIVAILD